jgi:endonuclease YncB( thermonuclease family)
MSRRQILLGFLVIFFAASASAEALYGRVVEITDGDTLKLLVGGTQHKIRLAEIDTPEKGQRWGSAATQALAEKVLYQDVIVDVQGSGGYGRLAGRIWLGQRDINRELVQEGHAWAYRDYLTDPTFVNDENLARQRSIGLWSMPDPTAPWLWRQGVRAGTHFVANGHPADKRYCGEMTSCAEANYYFSKNSVGCACRLTSSCETSSILRSPKLKGFSTFLKT